MTAIERLPLTSRKPPSPGAEYISPEIIKGVPYNHSVDWWSFGKFSTRAPQIEISNLCAAPCSPKSNHPKGVLLYEMAVGKMPFRGNDENELLWNVCYEQIHYPMFLTKELASLLQSVSSKHDNH